MCKFKQLSCDEKKNKRMQLGLSVQPNKAWSSDTEGIQLPCDKKLFPMESY